MVLGDITFDQYNAVYNALSFGIAAMGGACIFVYWQLPNVNKKYKTALIINALVTAIACYHYVRIFNSWVAAYGITEGADGYQVMKSGTPFNDAYRYVDWLLTVPLLLIELILVMGLSSGQTCKLSWQLGIASALMVAVGYPGEVSDDSTTRWVCFGIAMVFFLFVLHNLFVGLAKAASADGVEVDSEEEEDEEQGAVKALYDTNIRNLIAAARYLTAISWCTYPVVYVIKAAQPTSPGAMVAEQIGYSVADIVAKAVFGILIWYIASAKSEADERQ